MDKNAIKKYAVWARRELISRVSQKALQYGISEKEIVPASAASVNGVVLSAEEKKQRKALIDQIKSKDYKQVMEEVAYTWFNRFIALRFMEVNGYLPTHVRVFTDEDNAFRPQILTEAINLELDGLDMEKVYSLKDANDNESLFKYLIITQCNALSPIMPRMFQRIADYTELLFPDNLLREGSVIQQMIELIPEKDWKDAVQIIGWLYQFYNIEPKAEVFAKNGKISKEEIPAATQLFTPDWIVRYMVENSLGRLWIERNAANSRGDDDEAPGDINEYLLSKWKYYLPEADQEPKVERQLHKIRKDYSHLEPEQIKCIDPCAGSGHILAYMFDVLVQIYEIYGYTTREAVQSIIENNLYGLDIDERAAQLAYFAVMMKARQYDRRFFARKDEDGNPDVPQPHVYAIVESNGIDRFALDYFINGDASLKKAMDSIIKEMQDAKEYGSILKTTPVDFSALYARFNEVRDDIDMSKDIVMDSIFPLVQVAEALSQQYHIAVTNPPYMGGASTADILNRYIKKQYPDSKADLFAVFIERCSNMTLRSGYYAMITMHSWMFLPSYDELRSKLLKNTLCNMAHLGTRAFEEISGEVVQTTTFVFRKEQIKEYTSVFARLVDYPSQNEKEDNFILQKNRIKQKTSLFGQMPSRIFAYWLSDNTFRAFTQYETVSNYGDARQGMATGDNEKFVRYWYEPVFSKIGFGYSDYEAFGKSGSMYVPYTKSAGLCRWYGNYYNVLKFDSTNYEMLSHSGNCLPSRQYYFRKNANWSLISTGRFGARYAYPGSVFDVGAHAFYSDVNSMKMLGYLNSIVFEHFIKFLSPTINYNSGIVAKVPALPIPSVAESLAENNVNIAKEAWDNSEISWDFQEHPLIRFSKELWDATAIGASMHYYYGSHPKVSGPLELCYMLWQGECQESFKQLKANEEELNRIFIDIYGLQDELTPDVKDTDVTVRLADKKRDIKSLISYAVGCMFGRYSLDVPGLAYAGGEWDDTKYTTFKADKDSIIPICDDEYFADDIVGRFIRFIEVVYGKDTLQENLRFIAEALGGSGQPKEVIRNYFLNDFYADHLKVYQKRPIYWLFDSGKKNGFKALVYMHRYAPDTIARMRTDYVHEQQARYRTAIADLEQRIASASTAERVKLSKRLKQLQEQATEIQVYEEKIHHLADQYIAIDLDDGVKKNYAIFGDVLAKIK